jgi:hypothetical protein
MALHCPKCGSTRVRRGYEELSLPLRLAGIHSLLCDSCNLSYRGFALRFTVRDHSSRKSSYYKKDVGAEEPEELEVSQYARSHDTSVHLSEATSFAWYYARLRVNVLIGRHQTSHSLGIKYRWRNWLHWQRGRHLEK